MSTFLFYVEPFPIRNSFVHFYGIIENFINSLTNNKTNHQFYIYANKETIVELYKRWPELEKYFILPTKEDDNFFQSCMIDWDEGGLDKWQELMEKSSIAQDYITIIKQIYQRQPFDYIICWGTNFAVKQAAKELGIGFINMELGCSRPPFLNSLVADPWGVNGSSSISQSDIRDFDVIPTSNAEDDFLFSNGIDSSTYEAKFAYINASEILNKIGDKKIALISLQLYDDANQVYYSPFPSVKSVLETILPKLEKAGYVCIIKEHPASNIRRGSEYANLEAKLYALDFDNVIWLTYKDKNIQNSTLFRISDVVITVNSSSGFEALYYEKPVVVLGDAVYKAKNVFPSLSDFIKGNFNVERYKQKIAQIRNFFIKYYLFSVEQANTSDFFFPYLEFIGEMSKKNLSVKQIIEAYYKYNHKEQ